MYRIVQKFTEIHRNSQKFTKSIQKRTVMYRNVTEKYIFAFSKRKLNCNGENFRINDFDEF